MPFSVVKAAFEYLIRLDSYNVKYHSYTEHYISSLWLFADAIISILSGLADLERAKISDLTKAGLERTRAKELITQGLSYFYWTLLCSGLSN